MSLQKLAEVGSSPRKQKVQRVLELCVTLDIDIPKFRQLSIGDAIRRMKNMRSSLSANSPRIVIIDSILSLLLELEYPNPFEAGPYDINKVKRLSTQDNLLSDINEQLLFTKVSDLLEVKYLSNALDNWNWEGHAKGIVFEEFSRPIMSFPAHVEHKSSIMVHFLIDTGASNSEIPTNVYKALIGSTPEHIPSAFYGYVGGVRLELGICSEAGNHVNIPLLGQDFFKEARVEIKVNYATKTIEMTRVGQ